MFDITGLHRCLLSLLRSTCVKFILNITSSSNTRGNQYVFENIGQLSTYLLLNTGCLHCVANCIVKGFVIGVLIASIALLSI